MTPLGDESPIKRKGSFFRTLKAVLWSFVGLRARGESEKDVEELNPLHIIIAALIAVTAFVGGLVWLAKWAVKP